MESKSHGEAALEQLLRHATTLRYLRYLHWRNPGSDTRTVARPIGYIDTVEWTPTALTQLGLTGDKEYLYAHRALSPTRVAAFLSVVARESDLRGSALGRLTDRGVLTIILEFAASPVRRFLFIEPNSK
jgi:hypothetical protein